MSKHNRSVSTNIFLISVDIIITAICFYILYYINIEYSDFSAHLYLYLSFLLIYILSNFTLKLYDTTTFFYIDRVLRIISTSYFIAVGITYSLSYISGTSNINKDFYLKFIISFYICILVSVFIARMYIKHSKLLAPRTLFVGQLKHFKKFNEFLQKSNIECNTIGYISIFDEHSDEYLGSIKDLENIIRQNAIDQVYIMHRRSYSLDITPLVDICMEMGITVNIIMNSYKPIDARNFVSNVGTYPVLTYHRICLSSWALLAKRILDILGALFGIIITSPIMLLTAIAIKIDSKGPVIFKQQRVGQHGRHFNMYKFRSMCIDAEEKKKELMAQNEVSGNLMFKMKNDPRITKVGRFIRKTSIDELPQFFNVLIGNMSLVGTRPPTLDEVNLYNRSHWRRISIKPGITGMWQVSGRSSIKDFDKIVELDTEYIDRWSIFLDFKILIKTVLSVFTKDGAF